MARRSGSRLERGELPTGCRKSILNVKGTLYIKFLFKDALMKKEVSIIGRGSAQASMRIEFQNASKKALRNARFIFTNKLKRSPVALKVRAVDYCITYYPKLYKVKRISKTYKGKTRYYNTAKSKQTGRFVKGGTSKFTTKSLNIREYLSSRQLYNIIDANRGELDY